MIASLPMYERPETAAAHDRIWAAIRAALGYGPQRLSRNGDPMAHWTNPKLVLSQTCSLPFRTRLAGRVAILGTPDYGLDGCPPGYYRSAIVVADGSPADSLAEALGAGPIAINSPHSQSGWAALWQELAATGSEQVPYAILTGSHRASAVKVAEGHACLAALDAQTWRLITRHEPALSERLRVLCWTRSSPGLPLITAAGRDPVELAAAWIAATEALSVRDKAALDLCGLVDIPESAYLALPLPPPPRLAS